MPLLPLLLAAAGLTGGDILLLDLKPIGVDPVEVKVVDGMVAEHLAAAVRALPKKTRPRLATSNDLRTLSDIEAEKSAAGCDDTGCMAELAGALGARYVIAGSLGLLGNQRVLQLSLFDVSTGQALTRASAQGLSPEILASQLDDVTERILQPLAPASKKSAPSAPRPLLWVGGAVAAVGFVFAGVGGAAAFVFDSRLAASSGATVNEKKEALEYGVPVIVGSVVAGAVGVTGVVVAVVAAGSE